MEKAQGHQVLVNSNSSKLRIRYMKRKTILRAGNYQVRQKEIFY